MASNFVMLGIAEIACRAVSFVVTLSLWKKLGESGFGRVEFAFNIVFWLVLIVRDCFETIITREIARHPRLTRPLVNHVLAVKIMLALCLLGILTTASVFGFSNPEDRWILALYGLLLISTALGLDFVFRGKETMGLVGLSLLLRTMIYATGVWFCVSDPSRILLVPVWLALGEFTGIGLVWIVYARKFGLPRPVLGKRFLFVFLKRGRSVGLIHLCQAILLSVDLLVVGIMSPWAHLGRYSFLHRLITAVMAFGLIFQQVIFPSLSRGWRESPEKARRILDFAVQVLIAGFLPVAIGGTLLAEPILRFLVPTGHPGTGLLLAVGIWRAPLLCLAFLYQASLIAMNKETQGLRLLVCGSACSAPLIAFFQWRFGLIGAPWAVLLLSLGLVLSGYLCLHRGRCAPQAHHHLLRPLIASGAMVPIALLGLRVHVGFAILAGALGYAIVLKILGGMEFPAAGWDTITSPKGNTKTGDEDRIRSLVPQDVPEPLSSL
ncbi:MAG: flippase [Isosphaeraceae bacterium]